MNTGPRRRPTSAYADRQPRTVWPVLNAHRGGPLNAARSFRHAPQPRSSVIVAGASGIAAALFPVLYERGHRILALDGQFSPDQVRAAADPTRVVLRRVDPADPGTLPPAADLAAFLGAGAGISEAVLVHGAPGPAAQATSRQLTTLFLSAMPAHVARMRVVYVTPLTTLAKAPGQEAGREFDRAADAAAQILVQCVASSTGRRCLINVIDAGLTDVVGAVSRLL
jgi:hypothetical protein